MDFFESLTLLVPFVVLLIVVNSIAIEEKKQMEIALENGKIIETHINTTKTGNNCYFIILENSSGELTEYTVDLNTYVNLGGKLSE